MPVAKARAPSGASSTAAIPATISAVLTRARLKSCAPVNTSKVGASAVSAFAAHAPTSAIRISRRRPHRSASAIATNETSTPARATASATPSAWSERPNAAGDRVAVLREQRTAEVREQRDRGEGAQPPRLFRRERHRWHHRERLHRWRRIVAADRRLEAGDRVRERPAGAEPALDAQEPGEERHDESR